MESLLPWWQSRTACRTEGVCVLNRVSQYVNKLEDSEDKIKNVDYLGVTG